MRRKIASVVKASEITYYSGVRLQSPSMVDSDRWLNEIDSRPGHSLSQ